MSQTLRLEARREGAVATITLAGELDISTVDDLRAALDAVTSESPDVIVVVLDLRELRFLDSTGLRAVLAAEAQARANGHEFAVIRGPHGVHRVFEITGVTRRLIMIDGDTGFPQDVVPQAG